MIVIKDTETNRSRGFGFITYSHSGMVDKVQAARPHKIDGRFVETKRAVPRQKMAYPAATSSVTKIFVCDLKDEHNDEDLHNYFSTFGAVSFVDIIKDNHSGRKRGFAFVKFDDYDSVDKVVCKYTIQLVLTWILKKNEFNLEKLLMETVLQYKNINLSEHIFQIRFKLVLK